MREITIDEMRMLNVKHGAPMLSIYLNKDNGVFETKSFNERWKDSIQKAEFLMLKDYTRSFVNDYLAPIKKLDLAEIVESSDKGVAVFMDQHHEIFYLHAHSPIQDLTVVADSFHIKPLIKIKKSEKGFFLVAMTSRAVNVFIDNEGHLLRLDSYRNDPGIDGQNKKSFEDFFHQASLELNKLFASYRVPIILAGVKDNIGHMKRLLPQSMLMKESIVGNVEKMKTTELRERVYEILQPYYQAQELKSQEEIGSALSRDKALVYLEDIALSAVLGTIRKLYVVERKHVWGSINPTTGEIFITPKQTNAHDDDILDDLCQLVLSKGGDVEVVSEIKDFQGHLAVAIVTDRSHLNYNQSLKSETVAL